MKKRKRRRKLKKSVKIFLITLLVIAAVIPIFVFGFKIQTVKVNFDLGQYTEAEVKAYMDYEKIENTFAFWFKNKIGHSRKLDLFEKYSVKMNSPTKITITANEKKFKGYIKNDKMYAYFDDSGKVLKYTPEKMKSIPEVTGLKTEKPVLYKTLPLKDEKALGTLTKVTSSIEEYDFDVKKIHISENLETTVFIKDLEVQLGRVSSFDKKLSVLNDMYSNVIKHKGVLNMKRLSSNGSYTLKEEDSKTKTKKK